MSYVSQNIVLFPHKTVFENIMQPLNILKVPKKDKLERIKELGEKLGISILLTRRPRELSGGQQQRVAIARSLVFDPDIIFLDEPIGNLDSKTTQDVMGLLKVTSQKFGQTIVMITHNDEIAQLADRSIRIEDGMIVRG